VKADEERAFGFKVNGFELTPEILFFGSRPRSDVLISSIVPPPLIALVKDNPQPNR
jgi:hypothetical protein